MEKIKRIPVPFAGLILGLAALGNLIQSYSPTVRLVLGGISAVLFILLTVRIAANWQSFKTEMENPVVASVFATYSMAIMLLAAYLKPYAGGLAAALWYIGIVLHVGIIIFFTVTFAAKRKLPMVQASWFIPYVGIAVAGITAPAFKALTIGQISFYFGLVCYIILLPIVLYRIHKVGNIPAPAVPTIAITCAPGSLLLAAYMNSFPEKSVTVTYILLVVSQLLYLYALVQLPKLMAGNFKPSFSSFTFPFAISGIALKLSYAFLKQSVGAPEWVSYIVKFEELVATVFVLYVLVRYLIFIFGPRKANA